jgi:glycosyltransferase involved in cell wall biosynthesis
MIRDKGVVEFVDAARILHAEGVPAEFRLLGDPDEGNPTTLTEQDLRALNSEGLVQWHPHRADIGAALAQAHIIALPSYREGFPKTLIDAAAAGRASVASDVPGCRHAIIDGVTGILVPARDPGALADALRRLILDRGLQERMGIAARRHAEQCFDVQEVTSQHVALYARALTGR